MIDGLALSCLGLRSSFLNLVSHGDKMTAPRKEEAHGALHTHRVCSPGVPHMYSHTLMTQLQCWTKSCSRRVVRRGHTIGPLLVSLGTAELKISGLMLFNTPRRIVTASVTHCSSTGCVPTLWSNMSLFILCGMLSLGYGIVVKIQSARWQPLSHAETLPRLPATVLP